MSLEKLLARLDKAEANMRHVVRHNGGSVSATASFSEAVDRMLDIDPARVAVLYSDIGTIDHVKAAVRDEDAVYSGVYKSHRRNKYPQLTTEELLSYGVDDERLTAEEYSWAVLRITAKGTEILTYGGNYYQGYFDDKDQFTVTEDHTEEVTEKYTEEVTDTETGETSKVVRLPGDTVERKAGDVVKRTRVLRKHDTELLKKYLTKADVAWNAQMLQADIHAGHESYTEGGVEYIRIPCQLPGDLQQLVSVTLTRTDLESGTEAAALCYSLTDKSCDTSNAGMVELPHGIWLIYDNSQLASAPQGLLIPKDLADGTDTGFRLDVVRIIFNEAVDGLAQLRLMGDSFGGEYIVSTQEQERLWKGAWVE